MHEKIGPGGGESAIRGEPGTCRNNVGGQLMRFQPVIACVAILSLGACGVIYTAPGVNDGPSLGGAYGSAYDVEVVPLTYESAMAANLSPYVAPQLPAAFRPDAIEAAMASTVATSDLPALPPPTARRVTRPAPVAGELPPPGRPEPYRIGVGDVLLLAVREPTTLEGLPGLISARAKREGYVVQDDGAIAIPNVGRVQVARMTLEDAEAEITQALFAANIDPSFSLEVAEFNSKRVSVGGLVGNPTLVPITLQPLHLHEAIELAGGVAATDPEVTVIQLFRDGTTYRFGLERLIDDPAARRIILRDGDSIYVGTAYREAEAQQYFSEQLALRDAQVSAEQQRRSDARQRVQDEQALFEKRLELGAVQRYYAFRAGEVRNPGEIALPFESKLYLANVLLGGQSGGINIQTGDYGAIYVLREESDPRQAGGLTAYHLDAENAANLAAATRFEIRPNDVIFVAEQPVTSWNRAISQILPQLLFSLPRQVTTSGL